MRNLKALILHPAPIRLLIAMIDRNPLRRQHHQWPSAAASPGSANNPTSSIGAVCENSSVRRSKTGVPSALRRRQQDSQQSPSPPASPAPAAPPQPTNPAAPSATTSPAPSSPHRSPPGCESSRPARPTQPAAVAESPEPRSPQSKNYCEHSARPHPARSTPQSGEPVPSPAPSSYPPPGPTPQPASTSPQTNRESHREPPRIFMGCRRLYPRCHHGLSLSPSNSNWGRRVTQPQPNATLSALPPEHQPSHRHRPPSPAASPDWR